MGNGLAHNKGWAALGARAGFHIHCEEIGATMCKFNRQLDQHEHEQPEARARRPGRPDQATQMEARAAVQPEQPMQHSRH